jgi:hypothetical protein
MSDIAAWMEGVGSGEEAKNSTIIHFYPREVLNPVKTKTEGRPIYNTKTYVKKITPGDRLIEIDRPMRPEDPEHFPREWQIFQNKETSKLEGTPLEEWPYLNKTRVAELNALNIMTVEHVSTLSDQVSHRIMDFNDLRNRALHYLKSAKDSALSEKLQSQLDDKDEKIEMQAKLISDLNDRMKALETKRGPGRPKKVKDVTDTD